jgi:hypothetical protein
LTFIDLNIVEDEDKKTFYNILLANISLHELIFLSFYLCAQMNRDLHTLAKKYYLLDPLFVHNNLRGSFASLFPQMYNEKISEFQSQKIPDIS